MLRSRALWIAFLFTCTVVINSTPVPSQNQGTGLVNRRVDETTLRPKLKCADLRSLTGYELSIESASLVPATAETPEYCRIRGQILPEIQFDVNLPSVWNRRFYMFGNGGYAGDSLEAPPRVRQRQLAIRRGFVAASTNTGHDAAVEPLGTFAVNRQKLLDYAFRSLHVTAESAKRIATAYYGVRPSRSYFEGCSGGGRQALILAQRFPEDFDGIVAGAPVLNFTGTMVGYIQIAQALAAAPLTHAKLLTLAARVYAQCDERDGLKDGLIDDPRRCDFRPARDLPKCAEGADNAECFTAAQIGTLEKIYSDVKVQGKRLFPGWPVGAEVAGPDGRSGWDNLLLSETGQPTLSVTFAQTFFRYLAFPEKNPKYELSSFDFEKDPQRLESISKVLDATDPDLERFKERGGKLLMYFGWSDPALNAQMSVDYYESVVERMGPATKEFFRLFMVPGMFHCSGGVGCSSFDKLTPVMQWVEQGRAPERIVASRIVNEKAIRTRPLCPYPQVARYKGTGSIDDADSFGCQTP